MKRITLNHREVAMIYEWKLGLNQGAEDLCLCEECTTLEKKLAKKLGKKGADSVKRTVKKHPYFPTPPRQ